MSILGNVVIQSIFFIVVIPAVTALIWSYVAEYFHRKEDSAIKDRWHGRDEILPEWEVGQE